VVVCATAATARAGTALIVTGHGWGHGVGMSQWGAYGSALHGW
jgi:stage II sporulation protein D